MTANDTNSTSGATGGATGDAPTMLAAMVAGHVEAARAYGLPADALASAAGLTEADLGDPDGRIPLDRCVALWEGIAAAPRGQDFGFWLGRSVTVETLGVIGFAMRHAPDVRVAFRCLDRFGKLIGDVVSPIIDEEGEHVVFHRREPPRIARLAALAVSAPVGTLTLLGQLAGIESAATAAVEAAFQHPPPPNADRYRQELGCPVHFNAQETRLVLRRAVFDLPLRAPDAGLFAYLERHAQGLMDRLREQRSVAARVRQQLVERLRDGEPEQGGIARRLGMSERTLQRRLRDEGTTFAALVDEARLELARMYLADPKLAVFEIAFLLGYSEPSAFNRAFRRWTGASPSEHRRAR